MDNGVAKKLDGTKLSKPLPGLFAVTLIALLMATLIWERASWDDIHVAFGHTLFWQLLVWMPWIGIAWSIQATKSKPWYVHISLAAGLITLHYLWFRWVSTDISPFVGHPDTRYGVFPYFFLFWTIMDLALYAIVLAILYLRKPPPEPTPAETTHSAEGWSVLKNGDRHWIKADSIRWVEGHGYYARLHTDSGEYLLRASLAELLTALQAKGFVRVHRSTLVRLDQIGQLSRHPRGYWQVQLVDGTVRRVSREGRKQLRDRM